MSGEAFFIPQGGSWSATPVSYDYIFNSEKFEDFYTDYEFTGYSTPVLITGFTQSSINDLQVYGNVDSLIGGKFVLGKISIDGGEGEFLGVGPDDLYTAYTINDITYYDYQDGRTVFLVNNSGFTQQNVYVSAVTKNEALINIIDQPEVQSNVFIERGKNSGMENVIRLNEVDNLVELLSYGYNFYKINNSNNT